MENNARHLHACYLQNLIAERLILKICENINLLLLTQGSKVFMWLSIVYLKRKINFETKYDYNNYNNNNKNNNNDNNNDNSAIKINAASILFPFFILF